MADALEFITDLLSIADQFPEKNKNHFHKTCILYTASLIEGHLNYCLLFLWYTEIVSKDWIYSQIKESNIVDTSWNNVEILTGKREKRKIKLSWEVDFNALIDFAFKQNIISESLKNDLHKVRKKRNQIHLMKLKDIDRRYSKQWVDEAFAIASKLFGVVEKKVSC